MKQRILIKRIIAVILTLAVLVTGMPMTTVSAATGDIKQDALDILISSAICTLEAFDEMNRDMEVLHERRDMWYLATEYDNLPPNEFHIAVQADIVARYEAIGMKMEKK